MDFSNLLTLLQNYSVVIGKTSYPPLLFIFVLFLLFIIFYIRTLFYSRINKKYKKKNNKSYLIWQQFICYVVSVIISFSLTCIFENNTNFILNGLICPIIGFVSSLIFENKVLGITYSTEIPKNTSDDSKEAKTNEDKEEKIEKHKLFSDYVVKPTEDDFLSIEDMESENHNLLIKDKINELIDSRYEQAKQASIIELELLKQTEILNAMQNSMKDDKKLKLEKMIHECLNQGYAKPAQNKVITTDYRNYRALNGNGDIKELYEKHYLTLEVHEDRRKSSRNNQNQENDNFDDY